MQHTRQEAERIGQRIREARERKGMSQRQFAELIADRAGIEPESARRSLWNHEHGRFAPRTRTLEVIADLTELPVTFFLGEPEVSPNGEFRG